MGGEASEWGWRMFEDVAVPCGGLDFSCALSPLWQACSGRAPEKAVRNPQVQEPDGSVIMSAMQHAQGQSTLPTAVARLGSARNGYPALAAWIAGDPDNETFIYRKFNRLAARNLLALQCQLIELEAELDRYDQEAGYRQSQIHWENFAENAEKPGSVESKMMEVHEKIQRKLEQYQDALLRQSQIAAMDRPRSRALTALRTWFNGTGLSKPSNSYPIVRGKAERMYEDEYELASLRSPPDKDVFSQLLRDHWRPVGSRHLSSADGADYFLDRHVVRVVAVISAVVAAILLIGAIATLYFIQTRGARLGTIACFTVLFALSLGLLTNAKRAEIFAATAAYAAVLVVFVSGDLGGPSDTPCVCPAV